MRDEVEGVEQNGERRAIVSRRVGKPVEGKAVPARQCMVCRGCGRIVSVSDMRNRIDRECQQQSCEGNSQPLRRSSGQVHQAHERQRMTVGRRNRLRTSAAAVKYSACCYQPPLLSSWCMSRHACTSIAMSSRRGPAVACHSRPADGDDCDGDCIRSDPTSAERLPATKRGNGGQSWN